jgi:hypothetical protein
MSTFKELTKQILKSQSEQRSKDVEFLKEMELYIEADEWDKPVKFEVDEAKAIAQLKRDGQVAAIVDVSAGKVTICEKKDDPKPVVFDVAKRVEIMATLAQSLANLMDRQRNARPVVVRMA